MWCDGWKNVLRSITAAVWHGSVLRLRIKGLPKKCMRLKGSVVEGDPRRTLVKAKDIALR